MTYTAPPPNSSPGNSPQPFFIKSKLNSLVMGVEGGSGAPGSRVITAFQKHSGYNDDQLWYEDSVTGTIRTNINYHCMEVPVVAQGANLVVNAYDAGNVNQQWMVVGDKIQSPHHRNNVLDITNNQQTPGALISSCQLHGRPSQIWTLEYLHPSAKLGSKSRPFYIRSEMHGKVLDISGCNSTPGARLMMYDKNNPVTNNQLWYFDDSDVIRSSLNDFAFNPTSQSTTMQPYVASNPNQQWLYDGKKIYNLTTPNQVISVYCGHKHKSANVSKWQYSSAHAYQHWALDHVSIRRFRPREDCVK